MSVNKYYQKMSSRNIGILTNKEQGILKRSTVAILQKVRQHYLSLAQEYDFTVIDGQQSITVISEEILKEINCRLML